MEQGGVSTLSGRRDRPRDCPHARRLYGRGGDGRGDAGKLRTHGNKRARYPSQEGIQERAQPPAGAHRLREHLPLAGVEHGAGRDRHEALIPDHQQRLIPTAPHTTNCRHAA
jgi:hypothetical protein